MSVQHIFSWLFSEQLQASKMMICQCPLCSYKTTSKFNFERHLATHNSERKPDGPFTCGQCSSKFKSKFGLKGHIKTFHLSVGLRELLQCPECTYTSRHRSNFKRHLTLHSNDPKPDICLICEDCGSQFRSRNGLKLHRERVHISQKSELLRKGLSQCPVCNYTSRHASNFKRHMTTHDIGPKPNVCFVCEQCGSKFKSKYGLKIHTDSIHEDKYRFRCHVCGKGYNTLWNFQGHLRSHDSQVRVTCDICNAKFKFMSSLIRHKRQCHSQIVGQEAAVYTCEQCNITFGCSTSLKEHKNGMHGGKSLECDRCRKKFRWRSSLFYHQKTCETGTGRDIENEDDELAIADPEGETGHLDSAIAHYTIVDS